ncbi:SHOCT domain-containing protein [Pseudonocardia sp. RS11V-5]|uniref:SHOCT domain-containing protein n=1 Tax=Pseudonocardia terrae TaxID=2905831 RepID=UPI001E59E720|nr:SHOCT domain-containing protein [Pseudonocardia terrae]MCE3554197.1 SHOCT domain-containing protein [Pseudonocardia terrae]
MPGLLRGIARTAIIAGTASSVAGRVQRHQARKFADRDAETAADRERAYEEQMAPQGGYGEPAPPPPAPAATGQADMISQLKQLAELRDQGILTDDEFAAQKAKILG